MHVSMPARPPHASAPLFRVQPGFEPLIRATTMIMPATGHAAQLAARSMSLARRSNFPGGSVAMSAASTSSQSIKWRIGGPVPAHPIRDRRNHRQRDPVGVGRSVESNQIQRDANDRGSAGTDRDGAAAPELENRRHDASVVDTGFGPGGDDGGVGDPLCDWQPFHEQMADVTAGAWADRSGLTAISTGCGRAIPLAFRRARGSRTASSTGSRRSCLLVVGERRKPQNRIFYPRHLQRRALHEDWWDDHPTRALGPSRRNAGPVARRQGSANRSPWTRSWIRQALENLAIRAGVWQDVSRRLNVRTCCRRPLMTETRRREC